MRQRENVICIDLQLLATFHRSRCLASQAFIRCEREREEEDEGTGKEKEKREHTYTYTREGKGKQCISEGEREWTVTSDQWWLIARCPFCALQPLSHASALLYEANEAASSEVQAGQKVSHTCHFIIDCELSVTLHPGPLDTREVTI